MSNIIHAKNLVLSYKKNEPITKAIRRIEKVGDDKPNTTLYMFSIIELVRNLAREHDASEDSELDKMLQIHFGGVTLEKLQDQIKQIDEQLKF